jgi:integrase/recombinase XerD
VPLAFLREAEAVPALAPITADGPIDELLCDYRRYLACERGLAPKTVEIFDRVARMFLAEHDQEGAVGRLTAADMTAFLAHECPSRSIPSAQQVVTALRSLLRYLHVTGKIELLLRWAVPGVADRRGLSLPRGLEPAAVLKLLASCDRRTLVGRRNYAVLLLMARLGLRLELGYRLQTGAICSPILPSSLPQGLLESFVQRPPWRTERLGVAIATADAGRRGHQ